LSEILISFLLLLGTLTTVVGAIGIIRFPDVYNRMHAVTKNATLGVISILFSGILFFTLQGEPALKLLLVVPFLFWTASAGSFMIGRAAHRIGVPLSAGFVRDDLSPRRGTRPERD
jgi:multicomponent Na+:H+ antiporter subunit G